MQEGVEFFAWFVLENPEGKIRGREVEFFTFADCTGEVGEFTGQPNVRSQSPVPGEEHAADAMLHEAMHRAFHTSDDVSVT